MNENVRKIVRVFAHVWCLLQLVGCGPLGGMHSWLPKTAATIKGGGTGPGWGASFSDWETRKRLVNSLEEQHPDLYDQVSVYVLDKRVLVVGVLHNSGQAKTLKAFMEKNAKGLKVINKTVFAAKYPLNVRMHDLWLEKKIETMLLLSAVSSHNFDAIVFNKIAYVLGVARNAQEHATALKIIKEIKGLVSVEDYVRVVAAKAGEAEEKLQERVRTDVHDARKKQKKMREADGGQDVEGIPTKITAAIRPKVEVVEVQDG